MHTYATRKDIVVKASYMHNRYFAFCLNSQDCYLSCDKVPNWKGVTSLKQNAYCRFQVALPCLVKNFVADVVLNQRLPVAVPLVRGSGYRRMKLCLRRAKASAPAQKTAPRIKLVRINRKTVGVWVPKPTAVTGRFAA